MYPKILAHLKNRQNHFQVTQVVHCDVKRKKEICLSGVTSTDGNGLKTANPHDIYHINWSEKSNSKLARRSYFCFFLN